MRATEKPRRPRCTWERDDEAAERECELSDEDEGSEG